MMDTNWVAVVVAAVVYNVIGFAWYSDSLFGKQWRKEAGISKEQFEAGSKNMGKMFALMVPSSLIMAYVLSVVFVNFGAKDLSAALQGGFWIWLGFIATVMVNSVNYEGKSWNYFAITAGYQLVGLLAMGATLVMMM